MSTNIMTASRQWATRPADQRYTTLADLKSAVSSRRFKSRSVDIEVSSIHAEVADDTIVLNSGISPCEPSHWAFGQLARSISAPADYLRSLPTDLAVKCMNDGLSRSPRETAKFMTIQSEGDGFNTLQAVTSQTYGRIWDADCVSAVENLVEKSDGKFFNPKAYNLETGSTEPSGLYASDRDVFMFMIDGGSRLDVGPRAKLNRGFFVWNSEVGAKTFGLTTFLFNEVCGNHIVWGAQNVKNLVIRHSKNGPDRFDAQAMPALMQYVNSSVAEEESTIRKAMHTTLPQGDAFDSWIKQFKFNKSEIREAIAVANKEEGKCETVWDLMQGFTAYARDFDFIDARMDLQKRAADLLVQLN